MLSTVFYIFPLVPAGIFLGALVLLLVVPVFALAALMVALLVGLAVLLALAAAAAAAPVFLLRSVRQWPRPAPGLDAVRRVLRVRRRTRTQRQAAPGGEDALLERARQLG